MVYTTHLWWYWGWFTIVSIVLLTIRHEPYALPGTGNGFDDHAAAADDDDDEEDDEENDDDDDDDDDEEDDDDDDDIKYSRGWEIWHLYSEKRRHWGPVSVAHHRYVKYDAPMRRDPRRLQRVAVPVGDWQSRLSWQIKKA